MSRKCDPRRNLDLDAVIEREELQSPKTATRLCTAICYLGLSLLLVQFPIAARCLSGSSISSFTARSGSPESLTFSVGHRTPPIRGCGICHGTKAFTDR